MRSETKNLSAGSVVAVFLFTLVFSALPGSWFVDVWKFEMYWGCPAPVFIVGSPDFSHHYYSMWWQWYYHLPLDLVFWLVYFFFAAVAAGFISRRARGRIRPVYALAALGGLTLIIYAFVFRGIWNIFIQDLYVHTVA
jgi:hypothetical protein